MMIAIMILQQIFLYNLITPGIKIEGYLHTHLLVIMKGDVKELKEMAKKLGFAAHVLFLS